MQSSASVGARGRAADGRLRSLRQQLLQQRGFSRRRRRRRRARAPARRRRVTARRRCRLRRARLRSILCPSNDTTQYH